MNELLKGYKTLIFSAITTLTGISVASGLLSPEANDFVAANLEVFWGGLLALFGIISGLLRLVTTTPPMEKQ